MTNEEERLREHFKNLFEEKLKNELMSLAITVYEMATERATHTKDTCSADQTKSFQHGYEIGKREGAKQIIAEIEQGIKKDKAQIK